MKPAAIYCRVSTVEQRTNYSLATQVQVCLESARAHGYNVPEEYIFREEYTGASLERPELDKLRALAAVFALDLDRLARNTVFQKLIEEEFEHYKVPIQYATTLYDRTPEGAAQTGGLFLCRA